MEIRRLTSGSFPIGHKWAGCQWFGIDFLIDKSNKLSIHKPYVRSIDDTMMKVPVMGNDPKSTDPGGCIKRFLEKLSRGQDRLYCKVVPPSYRKRGEERLFYGHQPMGKDSIKILFKKGAKMMGLSCADDFAPHSLRHLFGNQLACNPSVSLKECMLSLRHSSASASMNYQERNVTSEENRLEALGFEPPTNTSTSSQVASYPFEQSQNEFSEDKMVDLQNLEHPSSTRFKSFRDYLDDFNISSKNYSTDLVLSQRVIENNRFVNHSDAYQESEVYVRRLENLPSTQAAIDSVKRDIEALNSETFLVDTNKSAERCQIISLGEQVNDLRNKCNSMAKELFFYKEYYYKDTRRKDELVI